MVKKTILLSFLVVFNALPAEVSHANDYIVINIKQEGAGALPELESAALTFYKEDPRHDSYDTRVAKEQQRSQQFTKLGFSEDSVEDVLRLIEVYDLDEDEWRSSKLLDEYGEFSQADKKLLQQPLILAQLGKIQKELHDENNKYYAWFEKNALEFDIKKIEGKLTFPASIGKFFRFTGWPQEGETGVLLTLAVPLTPGNEYTITMATHHAGKYGCPDNALDGIQITQEVNLCVIPSKVTEL